MAAKRNDDRATMFYRLYADGLTLRQIGEAHGVSNQTIYSMFARRGWPLRRRKAEHHQFFNGQQYARKPNGYYGGTNRARVAMHRAVWEFHHGQIPDGHQIHHRDGNRGNNAIENLMLVDRAEHSRRHMHAKMKLHVCPHCGGHLFPESL